MGIIKYVLISTISFTLSKYLLGYAKKQSMIDKPNGRSSHVIPKPRGIGLSIVILFYVCLIGINFFYNIPANLTIALLGGIFVALVGWLDDKHGMSSKIRFLIHLIASVWALYWVTGFSQIRVGTGVIELGKIGWIIGILTITWLINLYNFMDGIDGLAASEAVIACITLALISNMYNMNALALILMCLAACCTGFLGVNWPPAKGFMGDVASGFLGYILAVLAIYSEVNAGPHFTSYLAMLSVFVFDATFTLLYRLFKHENVFEAHRSHIYQLLTQLKGSHLSVLIPIIIYNILIGIIVYNLEVHRQGWLIYLLTCLAIIFVVLQVIVRKKYKNIANESCKVNQQR